MYSITTITTTAPSFIEVLQRWLAEAQRHWRLQRDARLTRQALSGLDDRMLRDLAIDRSEIGSVVHELQGLDAPSLRRIAGA